MDIGINILIRILFVNDQKADFLIRETSLFLKIFKFIFRERGRGAEWERNISWLLLADPHRGPGLQPRHVP